MAATKLTIRQFKDAMRIDGNFKNCTKKRDYMIRAIETETPRLAPDDKKKLLEWANYYFQNTY